MAERPTTSPPALDFSMARDVYGSIVRAMSEGVVVHDAEGRIQAANPAAQAILGLTLEQLTGRTPLDPRWRLVRLDGTPATADDIPSEITQRTGKPVHNVVLGVHRPDGALAWVRVNTDPVVDEATERPRLVVATFTDITIEVDAQRVLAEERAHFKRLVEVSPGGVYQYLVGPGGAERFPFMSARFEAVVGVSREVAYTDPSAVWGRVHPEDVPEMRVKLVQSVAGLTPWEHEFRMGDDAAGWRWLRARSVPERTSEGVLFTGVLLDIRVEHQLSTRLRRSARREAMGDLAAGVAHNFNNMLATILPNLEMLEDYVPPAALPILQDARRAARSAADLVRQLMAFARPEPAVVSALPVDLTALVAESVRLCRRTFGGSVEVVAAIPDEPIHVTGASSSFQQVALNLLFNARDATTARSRAHIGIELRLEGEHPSAEAVLIVHDNGEGMSAETLARLGEPFFTTKGPGRGTGLGLASTYGVVRDAGGTVRCHSALGEGTRFEIRLPARRPHPARAPASVAPSAAPPDAASRGRILIVEDERLVREALRRQLESLHYDVVLAASGEEALGVLDAERGAFATILMDLAMPGLCGPELLVRLREGWPDIPVVVLSGQPDVALEGMGAAEVQQKPLSTRELRAVLDRVIVR
jgi:PAS domain S-box-containing protein